MGFLLLLLPQGPCLAASLGCRWALCGPRFSTPSSFGFTSNRLQIRSGLTTTMKIPPAREPSRPLCLTLQLLQGHLLSPPTQQDTPKGHVFARTSTPCSALERHTCSSLSEPKLLSRQGRAGRSWQQAAPHPQPTQETTCLCGLKSLMPFLFAFLSSVYLLEVLLSLLKRRLCPPEEGAEEAQGFVTQPSAPRDAREERKKKAPTHMEPQLCSEFGKWVPQGHQHLTC